MGIKNNLFAASLIRFFSVDKHANAFPGHPFLRGDCVRHGPRDHPRHLQRHQRRPHAQRARPR